MSVRFHIEDGEGGGVDAGVTDEHALKVAIVSQAANTIPVAQLSRQKQLRAFLTTTGLVGGSKDMNVDGATTPTTFFVGAEDGHTKWFSALRIILHSVNMEINTIDLRRFGAATAVKTPLTNGIELYTIQEGVRTDLVAAPIKTTGDFLTYADSFVNLVNAVDAQDDFLSLDFTFDVPIVIPSGSSDQIACRIRDDLTTLERFWVVLRGYQEIA